MRDYLKENLKSKLKEIFNELSLNLKKNIENILEEKNREILDEKRILDDLEQKVDTLLDRLG